MHALVIGITLFIIVLFILRLSDINIQLSTMKSELQNFVTKEHLHNVIEYSNNDKHLKVPGKILKEPKKAK